MKRNAGEMGRAHHDERGFSIYPRETAPYRRVFGSQWCQGATDRGAGPSSLTVALLSRRDCVPTPVGKAFSHLFAGRRHGMPRMRIDPSVGAGKSRTPRWKALDELFNLRQAVLGTENSLTIYKRAMHGL